MKKYAIIVAGGNGTRMGAGMPKQFLLLQQKPLLWYTLNTFLQAFDDIQIILVLPKENKEEGVKIIQTLNAAARVTITEGGGYAFSFCTERISIGYRSFGDLCS